MFKDADAAFLFSEHSERCFLMTAAAWANISREQRQYHPLSMEGCGSSAG